MIGNDRDLIQRSFVSCILAASFKILCFHTVLKDPYLRSFRNLHGYHICTFRTDTQNECRFLRTDRKILHGIDHTQLRDNHSFIF